MSRLPVLNLMLVLLLITFIALRHSVSEFSAHAGRPQTAASSPAERDADSVLSDWSSRTARSVGDLWHRSTLIRQWTLEYQRDASRVIPAASAAENSLLEARFHVANAEVLAAATGERLKARAELDRAQFQLETALPLLAAGLRGTVYGIKREITDARTELETALDPDPETSDEQIKTNLDWAIAALRRQRP